jgi:hypothetical protein
MGRTCSTHERKGEKCIEGFNGKARKKETMRKIYM